MKSRFINGLILILSTFVFFGCSTVDLKNSPESFLSDKAVAVVNLRDFSDVAFSENAKFFDGEMSFNFLVELFFESKLGLDFTNDILPLMTDGHYFSMAVISTEALEQDPTIELYDAGESIEKIVVIPIDQIEKAVELLKNLSKKAGFASEPFGDSILVYNLESVEYYTIHGGNIIVANSKNTIDGAIEFNTNRTGIAEKNKEFLAFRGQFSEEESAFVYLNPIAQTGTPTMDQSYFLAFEDDGVAIRGLTKFDKKSLNKVNLGKFGSKKITLDKFFNGFGEAIFYSESYNLANAFSLLSAENLKMVDGFSLSFLGKTLEDGLYRFMNKGFGIAMYNSNGTLPALTLAFDASSDIKTAEEIYSKLDEKLTTYIASLRSSGILVDKSVKEKISSYDFAISNLPNIEALSKIVSDSFKLSFGVTDDEIFVVAIEDDVSKRKVNEETFPSTFKNSLEKIDYARGGIAFLNFDNLRTFIDVVEPSLLAIAQNAEAKQKALAVLNDEPVEITSFGMKLDKFKTLLEQFDYLIFSSDITSSSTVESRGFLKLK